MAERFVKFLYNKRNRRIAACALVSGLWLKNSLKHLWPEDVFFPMYGYPAKDSSILQAFHLLNRCAKDSGTKYTITPFVSRTTEVISAGFSAFGMGQSQIGIPKSFFCSNIEELSHLNIGLGAANRFSVSKALILDKLDENEIKLMENMLLSEEAKQFAIARHISYLKRNWALYQSSIPSFFVLIGYSMVYHSPRLLFVAGAKPVPITHIVGVSLLGGLLAYLLCKVAKSALCRRISTQADEDAASISAEYARGGIEMYDKLLETNKALRILFGRRGERTYSAEGEKIQNPLFNNTGPPFATRKAYLADFLGSDSISKFDKDHEVG